ncbi:hypothetical protein DSO57_1009502 [Entomophthora muscae]|uniref:Uncharacterized protein n=1 Tax=Entomophthora muscae TaxID=34485 RepID=A0ACC2USM6_9FUNG|nr:hypothetical protein DSO57_1009502 [Entomophthora muscae]
MDSASNISEMLPPLQAYPMEPPAAFPQPQYPLLPPIQQFPPVTQYPPLQAFPAGSPYPITAPPPVYPALPPVIPVGQSASLLPPMTIYPSPYSKQASSDSEEKPDSSATVDTADLKQSDTSDQLAP